MIEPLESQTAPVDTGAVFFLQALHLFDFHFSFFKFLGLLLIEFKQKRLEFTDVGFFFPRYLHQRFFNFSRLGRGCELSVQVHCIKFGDDGGTQYLFIQLSGRDLF